MKKKKVRFKKTLTFMLYVVGLTIIFFSVNKTVSRYNTTINISTLNALPILDIESSDNGKILEFIDYGWATYNFDIINGKMGNDGIFYVNEIDMEYYIDVVKDSGDLSLKLKALYIKNDNSSEGLGEPIPYVEGKGYGPFDLPYKVDDQVVLNPLGYYESKYISRVHYMLVYTYGTCESGDQRCIVNANEAGKDYNFHIEIKAYQKVS